LLLLLFIAYLILWFAECEIICCESLIASVVLGLWPELDIPYAIIDNLRLLSDFYDMIRSSSVVLLLDWFDVKDSCDCFIRELLRFSSWRLPFLIFVDFNFWMPSLLLILFRILLWLLWSLGEVILLWTLYFLKLIC
jgi:hypothetical protein